MYLISHFHDHIYKSGNIPMHSLSYWELANKEQIKDILRRSNKIYTAWQIQSSYSQQHAICQRLLNLEFLQCAEADLLAEVVEHLEKIRPTPTPPAHRRILKGCRDNIHNIPDFSKACYVSAKIICQELILYSWLSLPPECQLLESQAILQALPVELVTQLEILVLAFQEPGVYNVHRAWCTCSRLFRNQASQNTGVWIQAVGGNIYSAFRCPLLVRHIVLFKIQSVYMRQDTVYRLTGARSISTVASGNPSEVHCLKVTLQLRGIPPGLTIVSIVMSLGLAHLIPETNYR